MLQERYAKNIKINNSLLAKHINMKKHFSKFCQKDNMKVKVYMLTHEEFTNLKAYKRDMPKTLKLITPY